MGIEQIPNISSEDREKLLGDINNSLDNKKESLNVRLEQDPENMTFNQLQELLNDVKDEVAKLNEKSNEVKGMDPRVTELFERQRKFLARYQELRRNQKEAA